MHSLINTLTCLLFRLSLYSLVYPLSFFIGLCERLFTRPTSLLPPSPTIFVKTPYPMLDASKIQSNHSLYSYTLCQGASWGTRSLCPSSVPLLLAESLSYPLTLDNQLGTSLGLSPWSMGLANICPLATLVQVLDSVKKNSTSLVNTNRL